MENEVITGNTANRTLAIAKNNGSLVLDLVDGTTGQ